MSSSDRSSSEPQSLAADLEAQDWPRLRARLLRFAIRRARSRADAEDHVQEAVDRVFGPKRDPWNPEVEPELARHLMHVIDKIRSDERDKRNVRLDPRNSATVEVRMTLPLPTPEQANLDAEADRQARRRLDEVKADRSNDPVALEVIEQSEDGVDRPAEQARATGRTIEEIMNARKRIKRAIQEVLQREQSAPARKASP